MNTTAESQEFVPWKISKFAETILIILYFLITFIAISGNGIVCYLVFAYKRMHTVPNYFIFNLAVSDILVAIFCIPFSFVANLKNYWPFGVAMCPIVMYSQGVTVFLSSYTLVAMSIDRYFVIVHPFLRRITTRQTVFVIMAIWVISLAIPLPALLKSQILYFSNTSGQCLEIWSNNTDKYRYSLALMVLHYFGPLAILIFSYSKIGFNIWIKNFRGDEGNNRRLQLAAAKQKMIRMMITVVVSYALCWLPIHTVTLIGDQHPAIYNLPMMPVLWMLFHWLAMSNSCYNPIIYIWMSPKFRTGLKLSIQRCTRRRSLQQRPSDDNLNVKPEDVAKKKTVYCCLLEDKRRRFHDGYTPYRLGHCAYPPPPRLMPLDRLRLSASIHSDT